MFVRALSVCLWLLLLSGAAQAAEPTQDTGKSEPEVRAGAVRADEKGTAEKKAKAEKIAKAAQAKAG